MTQEFIFQAEQVIAKFMGWSSDEIRMYIVARNGNMGKIAFHERWDRLFDVIEKIESLPTDTDNGRQFQFSITGDGISITMFDDGSGIVSQRVNDIGKSKLQSTFEVVAEFCYEYFKMEFKERV